MAGGTPVKRRLGEGGSAAALERKGGSKNAWLPFLLCGAPALTALWMGTGQANQSKGVGDPERTRALPCRLSYAWTLARTSAHTHTRKQ